MKYVFMMFAFVPMLLFGQSRRERKAMEAQQKAEKQIVANLQNHAILLSKASLINSYDNPTAVQYIIDQFKSIGLQPKGDSGFTKTLKLDHGKVPADNSFLSVNGDKLEEGKDYFPFPYSGTGGVTGMPAMALRERGVPWFVNIEDWVNDSAKMNGSIDAALEKEAAKVAAKGATALIIYNTGAKGSSMHFDNMNTLPAAPIPLLYIMPKAYEKYFSDHSQVLEIGLNVAFKTIEEDFTNVAGYIDNGAVSTVVVTANHNRSPGPATAAQTAVKNNTSTALLIELARILTTSNAKSNNYLFISSGCPWRLCVDTSLAGSFHENYQLNLEKIDLYDKENSVKIIGSSTSPDWQMFAMPTGNKLEVTIADTTSQALVLPLGESVPVITFSTTSHQDDAEAKSINYQNVFEVLKLVNHFIDAADTKGKLAPKYLAATPPLSDTGSHTAPPIPVHAGKLSPILKTTVSLGIIPDKNGSQSGLKIVGVSPKKLAEKLGLQAGDVLTRLGDYPIQNMRTYMQALAAFSPGDKTVLHIKRGKEDKDFAVEF